MEWSEEFEEEEPGHRHISHLFGLHPGKQITIQKNPELIEAARKTIDYRLSHAGEIHLLPAFPNAWPDGHIHGLCARGGFIVEQSRLVGTGTMGKCLYGFMDIWLNCYTAKLLTVKLLNCQTIKQQYYFKR
jgi:hypothetical protein